jgi:hypothetical protein
MNQKIDLSNEDHCGPCGQYALKKIELTNNKINKNIDIKNNLKKQNIYYFKTTGNPLSTRKSIIENA